MTIFRNPEDAPKSLQTMNCLLCDGGAGDLIAALTAVDYLVKRHTWINFLVWVPNYLLDFAKNVLPENTCVRNYSQAKKKYNNKLPGVSTKWDGKLSPMRIHPIDYAFLKLCDENPAIEHKNYLKLNFDKIDISRFNLPEKYVVLPVGAAARVKEMPVDTINYLAFYIKHKGYVPVFTGKSNTDVGVEGRQIEANMAKIDYSKGIDLTNSTSFTELGKIIQGAKCFVGMDGGSVHVAGCTDTPIAVAYTFVDGKRHNVPIRNNQLGYNCYVVEPDETLGCRFCQSNMNFINQRDARDCYYDDYLCTKQVTPDKFIKYLEKIL